MKNEINDFGSAPKSVFNMIGHTIPEADSDVHVCLCQRNKAKQRTTIGASLFPYSGCVVYKDVHERKKQSLCHREITIMGVLGQRTTKLKAAAAIALLAVGVSDAFSFPRCARARYVYPDYG